MIRRMTTATLGLAVLFVLAAGRVAAAPTALPARVRTDDVARHIDGNRINMRVANSGWFPFSLSPYHHAGLVYPRGTANSILYVSGLWLGGTVGGGTRVALADYLPEFAPGAMAGGLPDDSTRPEYVVYKVARWTGNAADSSHVARSAAELAADPELDPLAHHSWSEYMAGAAPHGAPWRVYRLPDTSTPAAGDSVDVPGPDVRGDQMLWCVFNDADALRHVNEAGSTAPLGVEVRQTLFAYDRPGPLGNTVFVRWDVLNRGGNTIPDFRMGVWSDPDVGSLYQDDLAGCDTTRSLGYVYNTFWGSDPVYGAAKPAVGFDLLAAHDSPALLRPSGMDACVGYNKAVDPVSADESWSLMRGLQPDGSPHRDPATSVPTPFVYAGDPVAATGWIDQVPTDKRILVTSGPWAFAPGDSLTFWVAIIVGQGETPAASLLSLRCASDDVQDVFDAGFAEPFAAPRACVMPPGNCPRGADWWAEQCTAGAQFSTAEWNAIARWADSTSAVFSFGGPDEWRPYCFALRQTATAGDSALREYLAVLSNVAAGLLGLMPDDGQPARLTLETGVAVTPPLLGTSVAGLVQAVPSYARGVWDARYENDVPDHRRALEGVPNGLPLFGGGAGAAADYLGSTLDPVTMPDSFPAVLLRFHDGWWTMANRYLRLETVTGAEPAGGRGWIYAGRHRVWVTAWDLHTGRQLELAFSERAVTAADGTLLEPAAQPATFDSTWAPDASDTGAFECLWVLKLDYTSTIRQWLQVDGLPGSGQWPALYALTARLRDAADVIDDGDGFRFVAGYPPTTSAEALLRATQYAAPADSEAWRLNTDLAAGLSEVNLGLGIGPVCAQPAPCAAALVEASAQWPNVSLRWRLAEPTSSARLEWRSSSGVWLDGGPATIEPGGEVVASFVDAYEYPPVRRAYRLVVAAAIGIARSDSVWIEAPGDPPALAMTGVWPNPAGAAQRVSFTLPSAGEAKLEVFDLNGRRTYERDLGTLAPGLHHVEISPGVRLRPGVYFAVLRFGGERKTARFVAL